MLILAKLSCTIILKDFNYIKIVWEKEPVINSILDL